MGTVNSLRKKIIRILARCLARTYMAPVHVSGKDPAKRWQTGDHIEEENSSKETTISVKFIQKALRSTPGQVAEISLGAGIYLSGVLEYLIAEILDTAIKHAVDNPGKVQPNHILEVLRTDEELTQVFPALGKSHYYKRDLKQLEEKHQTGCPGEFSLGTFFHDEWTFLKYLKSVTRAAAGVCRLAKTALNAACLHLQS